MVRISSDVFPSSRPDLQVSGLPDCPTSPSHVGDVSGKAPLGQRSQIKRVAINIQSEERTWRSSDNVYSSVDHDAVWFSVSLPLSSADHGLDFTFTP